MRHVKLFSKLITTLSVCLILIFTAVSTVIAAAPVQKTVEGNGNYFVTGESYPTSIVFTGYNSRDKKVYLNIDMETTLTVSNTATFKYYVNIFDSTSTLLGKLGDDTTPQTVTSTNGADSNKVKVTDKAVTLSSPLTPQYRIIVTVDSVAMTP